MSGTRPTLYVIAGPNGAGKTTFAREFLPLYADCRNFINADLIAQGVSPFAPETAALRAGRLMLREIARYAKQGADFGFETTLSGRFHLRMFRQLKRQGYTIHIFFLWVPDVQLAISRVRERVLRGGHDVPEPVLRRRFDRSTFNFLNNYRRLADFWNLFDNSGREPALIASGTASKLHVRDQVLYNSFARDHGEI